MLPFLGENFWPSLFSELNCQQELTSKTKTTADISSNSKDTQKENEKNQDQEDIGSAQLHC